MVRNPLVSVIIPNYNHALYLQERISSVLNQKFDNFELIILDDCSTDNSKDIIKEFEQDPHVTHVVYNSVNTGNTFVQWEKGIDLARGKYVWIAESDDVADENFLSIIIPLLENNPSAVVAFSHSWTINENGDRTSEDWHGKTKDGDIDLYKGRYFAYRRLLTANYIFNASMVVFLRSAFSKVDDSYKKFRYCGDWAFWARMCLLGDVIEVSIRLNSFRQHMNKVSARGSVSDNAMKDAAAIVNDLISLFKLNYLQKRAHRGFWTVLLKTHDIKDKHTYVNQYPKVFDGNRADMIFVYANKTINKFIYKKLYVKKLKM